MIYAISVKSAISPSREREGIMSECEVTAVTYHHLFKITPCIRKICNRIR